jgi:hypothetical protein
VRLTSCFCAQKVIEVLICCRESTGNEAEAGQACLARLKLACSRQADVAVLDLPCCFEAPSKHVQSTE